MTEAAVHTTEESWQIWIDTGGTFTDCLAYDPQGRLHRVKVLTSGALRGRVSERADSFSLVVEQNWGACDDLIAGFSLRLLGGASEGAGDSGDGQTFRVLRFDAVRSSISVDEELPEELTAVTGFEVISEEPAPILAARLVTGTAAHKALPDITMRLATTRGTNALLERRGAPMALFITQGFGDLLAIGDQQRPDLFALKIEKPPPLHEEVVEVMERLAVDGSVLVPLNLHEVQKNAERLIARGIRVAAVALMHSHVNPVHEQQIGGLLRSLGFDHVSISSDLAPLIRLLPRAQTAVVDAYLSPAINQYLKQVCSAFSGRLHVMTSAGGLVDARRYRSCDSLLSGPAGGVAGAAVAGRQSGFRHIIGFDMGGTSTDVARYDGDFEYRFEQHIAGVRLMAPALAIETVAAGGGSICDLVDDRFIVGPRSAGANPGPACYGAGGPLTLTDVNLLLGRLDVKQFEIPIRRQASVEAFAELIRGIKRQEAETILEGFLEIANERMAAAIEQISVRQGYDPKEHALVAFGGAGGQHACAVAERLGIGTVIMPAEASLLSALGLGQAAIERFAQRQVLQRLDECAWQLLQWADQLSQQAISEVAAEGISRDRISIRRAIFNLRLLGQDATLSIEIGDLHPFANDPAQFDSFLRRAFAQRYRLIYGHDPAAQSQKPVEVESIRVVASSSSSASQNTTTEQRAVGNSVKSFEAQIKQRVRARFGGQWIEVPAFDRNELSIGAGFRGPALVLERRSTCVIEPDWEGRMDAAGALIVTRAAAPQPSSRSSRPELIELELFSNRFASIADEMGQMLQRTALSTNVKERLDFSCALLDAQGELVVNAPHIPVHLGALGVCVRAVREVIEMNDGDAIVTNHPAFGGSHLPDVTVMTPVFAGEDQLIGYVASRAHHAEIGGTRPGSMPPTAKTLAEEGVVIAPRHILHQGLPRFDEIETLLRAGPYPSRAVDDNMADLRAAVAANHRGALALRRLVDQYGAEVIATQMAAIKNRAERLTRQALSRQGHGRYEAIERLDDGSPIQVMIELKNDGAVIDFSGSAAVHPGNLNATPAIVRSAVIYVMRLLIGERLPLNEGIMRAVQVHIPPGMLNPVFDADPAKSPAVVGGNTETSQRVVDTLLKALRLCACSQGTMNNVLFGNLRFGYYETVCGGCGAGPGFEGASAVHSHMTNTRITDPEIIEHRYPVRIDRFAIRRGSGGAGKWGGGDGAVREITFLEPMSLSVLSQHRKERPYGLEGGEPGAAGRQRLIRASGEIMELKSIDGVEVGAGDRLILETPGGGGFGHSGAGGEIHLICEIRASVNCKNSTPYTPARRGEKRERSFKADPAIARALQFHAVPAGTARREEREPGSGSRLSDPVLTIPRRTRRHGAERRERARVRMVRFRLMRLGGVLDEIPRCTFPCCVADCDQPESEELALDAAVWSDGCGATNGTSSDGICVAPHTHESRESASTLIGSGRCSSGDADALCCACQCRAKSRTALTACLESSTYTSQPISAISLVKPMPANSPTLRTLR